MGYLLLNDIQDGDQKRAALVMCGAEMLELLKSLVGLEQIWAVGYDCLIKALDDHFKPQPSKLRQTLNFYAR